MQRISTTVVALVGADAARWAREVGAFANVRAMVPEEDDPLDRAVAA
ncbi:MAG TPA: hypothetical protein VK923_13665 [Euzebyales bacterium]|nr:hypothetical protein [Euzebyales bacterium]